jgi:acyl carrier protein
MIEHIVEFEAPATDDEITLARVWSELLNVEYERIGRDTSFFELGGDSISAIQLIALAKKNGILNLTTNLIFKRPTLRQLAAADRNATGAVVLREIVVR